MSLKHLKQKQNLKTVKIPSLSILISLIIFLIPVLTTYNVLAFGFCGGTPSAKQLLTKKDTQKAYSILKTTKRDSIKNNCMDCHYMVNLVSKMNKKQRIKWFKGIKDLRAVINKLKS